MKLVNEGVSHIRKASFTSGELFSLPERVSFASHPEGFYFRRRRSSDEEKGFPDPESWVFRSRRVISDPERFFAGAPGEVGRARDNPLL